MSVGVTPILIRMHADDNVAIVANDGGLGAGTQIPDGPTLLDKVPQGHKLALENIPTGSPVRRYGVIIGTAKSDIAAGRWVHERLLDMPAARSFDGLPMATVKAPDSAPLDGVDQLTSRAATPEIAEAIIRELDWYDRYLARGHADRSANTTPGNKAGGLSNIVEKAMGSIVKSGSSAIAHMLPPGEKLRQDQRGLVFAATPASDFICGTLQLAAGMNLHVFTTGCGTPYGLAACPVIKVATRTDLARRWHDLMDLNAGLIADGKATIEDTGWALFKLLLDTASGRPTWAEQHRLHNALVLFNPAPVT